MDISNVALILPLQISFLLLLLYSFLVCSWSVDVCRWWQFHQYQVVGRALPTETEEHPKIYRMKLWATNEVRAKSKFWLVLLVLSSAFTYWMPNASLCLVIIVNRFILRYFLRKLKKVKKSNGQVLAINEVCCLLLQQPLLQKAYDRRPFVSSLDMPMCLHIKVVLFSC